MSPATKCLPLGKPGDFIVLRRVPKVGTWRFFVDGCQCDPDEVRGPAYRGHANEQEAQACVMRVRAGTGRRDLVTAFNAGLGAFKTEPGEPGHEELQAIQRRGR